MKRLTLPDVRPSVSDILLALALLTLVLLLADTSYAQSGSPYGYVRTLEGDATLVPVDDEEEPFTTSINQPVLPGDRLYVEPGGRLEVVLPEGTRVRAGDGAELGFTVLGAEEDDEGPRMQLLDGELQLTVPDVAASSETPRIDTHNASVYAVDPGQFSVRVRGTQNTLVTVRSGTVEVRTPRGASILRADEALSVDGGDWPEVALVEPPAWTSLEVWGYDLDQRVADARVPEELSDDLAYDTAPLEEHGDWVDVEGQYAWRPAVDYDWRPYTAGRWYYTPAGLSWVSPEPWGWATYHYGSWDWVSHYGWIWFPARRWAPAHVYWYWGPDYVGWCPVGVYARHYGRRYHHGGFRWGTYGWAGGSWGHYKHWTFVSHGRLHERDLARHAHLRASVTRPGGRTAVPRGLITTDTSGLSRAAWKQPGEAAEVLSRRAVATRPGGRAELPDVTSFVARSDELSPEVERRVVAREPDGRSITPPSAGRQALRRIGSAGPERSAAPGRAVVRVPRDERRPAADATGDTGRSVGRRDGEAGHGAETWRRSPDAPSAVERAPSARSVRTPSRAAPASPPSRSTDRGRDEVRAAPSDRPARARPPVTREPDRSEPQVRAIPDSRSDWRRGSSPRAVAPRGDAGDRTPDGSPPVRRVIDAVRGTPAAPPVRRAAPPTSRAAPPRATTPTRSAPTASPGRSTIQRPDARSTPPSRSSSGASSRSPSRRVAPSPPPRSSGSSSRGVSSRSSRSSDSSRASSSSRSAGSSSRGVSSRSSRSSGSSRASSPPPRRESSSRGSESRGRAGASRRSPD